ncbi:MAG: hypothetical protein ABEK59_01360 [Halobacteria archaeon]
MSVEKHTRNGARYSTKGSRVNIRGLNPNRDADVRIDIKNLINSKSKSYCVDLEAKRVIKVRTSPTRGHDKINDLNPSSSKKVREIVEKEFGVELEN